MKLCISIAYIIKLKWIIPEEKAYNGVWENFN